MPLQLVYFKIVNENTHRCLYRIMKTKQIFNKTKIKTYLKYKQAKLHTYSYNIHIQLKHNSTNYDTVR